MALTRSALETEFKSRARRFGAFTASDSIDRMRYALLAGAMVVWNLRDWRFKNQTASLDTTAGNKGPYTAPTGFIRFAAQKQWSLFGFVNKDAVAPILSTTDLIYTPYFRIQDSKIMFFTDPGTATLTLNYVKDLADSITEASLDTSIGYFPEGLKGALLAYALADLYEDLPSMAEEAARFRVRGRGLAEDYWHESTLDSTPRVISPRGVNKVSIDNHAKVITILGSERDKWRSEGG